MSLESLYSFTSEEFVSFVLAKLAKGKRHALLYYQSKVRSIPLKGIESHSTSLLDKIAALTDSSLPEMIRSYEGQTYKAESYKEGDIKKFLLKFSDGLESESVLIPMQRKTTLCVSSQVGCKMGCRFCETGKMGKIRSLKAEEILFQWIAAKHFGKAPSNIVFMGMGEPMDNLEEVVRALKILTDPHGIGLAPSRITVSTSGVVDKMKEFYDLAPKGIQLAVSVNAPNDILRNQIMPVNRKWNLQALYDAMLEYCNRFDHTVLVEYVLLAGVNDSANHAEELAKYLEGLNVKVNLIPYNAQTQALFAASSLEQIDLFAKVLRKEGLHVLLRQNKGRSLMAACGQLGNVALRKNLRMQQMHAN